MYKVLNDFIEKNHNGHLYKKGDEYPVNGHKLVKKRATDLTKVHDMYGVAFLKELPQEKTTATTKPVEDKAGDK